MSLKFRIVTLLPQLIRARLDSSNSRTKNIAKNAILSLLMKSSNIFCSLLIVPLTIDYVNPDRYGIWLTISSIVGWILFFDLGLGNGFRNHFVQARAENDTELCRKYVSTTYCTIALIVLIVWILAIFFNSFLDWTSILNVSESYSVELHNVVIIVLSFSSLNMIVNLFSILLTADLRPGFASVITAIGQWLVLLGIIILKKTTEGNLEILAFVFSGIPALTMLSVSASMFIFSRYRIYRPSIKLFDRTLLRNIMGLGVKFFLIYLCMIAIFQIINMVISREIGPVGVTQYNIAHKYFYVVFMIVNILITPLWSAVTDAYSKSDYGWLKSINKRMTRVFIWSMLCSIILLITSPFVYKIWIGDSVYMPFSLSVGMTVCAICQTLGTIFMGMINGIGTVRIQLIIYFVFAIVSWPLLTYAGRLLGISGIIYIPALVYLVQGVFAKVQFNKLVSRTAHGIWMK